MKIIKISLKRGFILNLSEIKTYSNTFFFSIRFFFVKNCILKNTGFETVSGLVRPKNTKFVHKNSKITNLTKYFDHFQPQIFRAFFGLS